MCKSLFFITLLSGLLFYSCSSPTTGSDPTTQFQVTLSPSPVEGGSVSPGDGQYDEGRSLEISATPNEGWLFDRWKGDFSGSGSTANITVDADKNIIAVFEKKSYTLTTTTDGEGTIEESIVQNKATDYEHGTVVELTANPKTGWTFVEWQGDITGTQNPQQLTVEKAKDVIAVFEKKSYPLTTNTDGEGTVDEVVVQNKVTDYEHGTVVELTANPKTGWTFVEWQGDITGPQNPQQLTVDNPKDVTAVFAKKSYPLTLSTTGQGSIAKNPDQQEYKYGTPIELTATAANGWKFVEWQGDLPGSDNPLELTVDGAKDVTAVFAKKSYVLTVNTNGQGTVSKSPSQATYESGTQVELTASPASGWKFVEWQGDLAGSRNPEQVIVDNPKEVTAMFTEDIATFYLAQNGVTIKCEDASIGETGVVNGTTYTKRSRSQVTTYNAETTCTSGISNMYNMFEYNSSFNGDISSWDVSSVTSMGDMFQSADSFNGDLSNWDVSGVTNMSGMFSGAISFNTDISSWDVSSVTDMNFMFNAAYNFNQDLNAWKVKNVTDMSYMFSGADSFNGDISSWDVSNVEDMTAMFEDTESFNRNLNNWDVSSVTVMEDMFYETTKFNQNLSNWNVSNVINMSYMFEQAISFNGNIGSWDVSNVEDMEEMFDGAESFNQNLNSWNVSSVIYMADMFNRATSFNGDISDWNVSNVEDMEGMFLGAISFNQDLGDWDVGDVYFMDYMFKNATSFNQDISGWCVIEISSQPNDFSTGSALTISNKPDWGTCK